MKPIKFDEANKKEDTIIAITHKNISVNEIIYTEFIFFFFIVLLFCSGFN